MASVHPAPSPVALVVPIGTSFRTFDHESFAAGLAMFPWLELWIACTKSQRRQAERLTDPRVRVFEVEDDATESLMLQMAMKAALAHDYSFVGYWGPDCEVPLSVLEDFRAQLQSSSLLMVFGSRLRLVQSRHPGMWLRHYGGRALASAISLMLKLQVYDTECCAKLFRNNTITREVFDKPFVTSVCFDLETFQRLLAREAVDGSFHVDRQCLEYVLRGWRKRKTPRYGISNTPIVVQDFLRLRHRLAGLNRSWT